MGVEAEIEAYLAEQPEPKRGELLRLHRRILDLAPQCRLWFLDGRDEEGRIVSNPNIGYGSQTIRAAGGKSREFYRIGLSANTTGISLYVIGLDDRKYLADTYGSRLGKATVTGYCIKFRGLKDVDVDVLEEIIRFGLQQRGGVA